MKHAIILSLALALTLALISTDAYAQRGAYPSNDGSPITKHNLLNVTPPLQLQSDGSSNNLSVISNGIDAGDIATAAIDSDELATDSVTLVKLDACAGANEVVEYQSGTAVCISTPSGDPEVNDLEAIDPPNVEDDEVYVGTGTGAGEWILLPDCSSSGNALIYDQATNTWGCNTDTGDKIEIDGVAATDPDFRSDGSLSVVRCTAPNTPDTDCVEAEDVIYRYNTLSIVDADISASAAILASKLVGDGNGILTTDGLILDDNETVAWASGELDHDGTTFSFDDDVTADGLIARPVATPSVTMRDLDTGAAPDNNIVLRGNCPNGSKAGGDEDCDFTVHVQVDGDETGMIYVEAVSDGVSTVHFGEFITPFLTIPTNRIQITQGGVMTSAGDGSIQLIDSDDIIDLGTVVVSGLRDDFAVIIQSGVMAAGEELLQKANGDLTLVSLDCSANGATDSDVTVNVVECTDAGQTCVANTTTPLAVNNNTANFNTIIFGGTAGGVIDDNDWWGIELAAITDEAEFLFCTVEYIRND